MGLLVEFYFSWKLRDVLVRHRNLGLISIWIVTKAIRVNKVKMEQPIGEKKPKRV